MITSEMHKQYFNSIKIIILSFFLLLKSTILLFAGDNIAFDQWKKNFKLQALKIGEISKGSCFFLVTLSVETANTDFFSVSITKIELSDPINFVPRYFIYIFNFFSKSLRTIRS